MEEQCGCLKRKGCPNAVFPLKTAIQLRRKHNQESYVVFVDLVKASDTVNHKLMALVLKKYGFPPKMRSTIERMYEKFALELKKGNEKTQIDYLTGVHQGDNLAPLLFVLVFQAAMGSIELTNECKSINKPEYKYFPNTQKDKPRGRLTGQGIKAKGRDFTH